MLRPFSGQPDDANTKAIVPAAKLVKQRDINHKNSYEKAFKAWNDSKVEKELMARSIDDEDEARDACEEQPKELGGALKNAYKSLHKKEGNVDIIVITDVIGCDTF